MNEIDETVLIKIPGYEKSYCVNKETNEIYSLKWKRYMKCTVNNNGYKTVFLSKDKNRKLFLLHRLVFLVHQGYLPEIIDHMDGNRTNNSIDNLREVTRSQNMMNSKMNKKNTSGYKGVCKDRNGWRSHISFNGQIDQKNFKQKCHAIYYNRIMRNLLHGEYKREN